MDNRICNGPKDELILSNAKHKITEFDRIGLHYNLVAQAVDEERKKHADPFDESFLRCIIAMLISFDMGRMMGKVEEAYSFEEGGFGLRLKLKLEKIAPSLERLRGLSISDIDLKEHERSILRVYSELSGDGEGALNQRKLKETNGRFHVGAAKTLHFLNPGLFIIVDSYAAKAFQMAHRVNPGYSSRKYLQRMECAQSDIRNYGESRFQELERGTPMTRIYDKLTFMTGKTRAQVR